jgi:hypothetical protein
MKLCRMKWWPTVKYLKTRLVGFHTSIQMPISSCHHGIAWSLTCSHMPQDISVWDSDDICQMSSGQIYLILITNSSSFIGIDSIRLNCSSPEEEFIDQPESFNSRQNLTINIVDSTTSSNLFRLSDNEQRITTESLENDSSINRWFTQSAENQGTNAKD